jgi:Class III cytochrome C family
MKKGTAFLALVLGVAVLAAFSLAYAATKMPEQDITIHQSDVFKSFMQGPVKFSHEKHKALDCTACHHEYKNGKNVWTKGQEVKKCSACHKLKANGKVVKLKNAFHNRCIKCHKAMKKEGKKAGPTACNKCHQKKQAAK